MAFWGVLLLGMAAVTLPAWGFIAARHGVVEASASHFVLAVQAGYGMFAGAGLWKCARNARSSTAFVVARIIGGFYVAGPPVLVTVIALGTLLR